MIFEIRPSFPKVVVGNLRRTEIARGRSPTETLGDNNQMKVVAALASRQKAFTADKAFYLFERSEL